MSDVTTNDPSGVNPSASGANDQKKEDVVAYETHRKLLAEKKKLQEEFETLKAKESEREKQELEKQGNYQKLLEQERAEKAKLSKELEEWQTTLANAKKRQAVLRHIAGQVPEPAREWIKVDGVAIKDDGSVDEDTAKLVAQQFEQQFAFAVQRDKQNGGLPMDAAKGGAAKLTVSQWRQLPTSKEMKEKLAQVDWNTD